MFCAPAQLRRVGKALGPVTGHPPTAHRAQQCAEVERGGRSEGVGPHHTQSAGGARGVRPQTLQVLQLPGSKEWTDGAVISESTGAVQRALLQVGAQCEGGDVRVWSLSKARKVTCAVRVGDLD